MLKIYKIAALSIITLITVHESTGFIYHEKSITLDSQGRLISINTPSTKFDEKQEFPGRQTITVQHFINKHLNQFYAESNFEVTRFYAKYTPNKQLIKTLEKNVSSLKIDDKKTNHHKDEDFLYFLHYGFVETEETPKNILVDLSGDDSINFAQDNNKIFVIVTNYTE